MKRQYLNDHFPHLLHGADYNPEQWIDTKDIWDKDMELMVKANCNEMSVGIFSWSMLEPREGEFDFSFLDEIIDKIYQNGGRVVLATPTGARPRWMAEKYPEVLRVNYNLDRLHYNERHNHCYTSPVYRQKAATINTLLAKRYGKHPAVVAWHISNEYGGQCFCPKCQDAFRDFLRQRYDNDIDRLNHAYWSTFWSHRVDSFDQIEAPSALGDRIMHALILDWRRFVSHQTLDFMKAEIAAIRAVEPNLPVTTNMMPGFYDLDYFKFADELDVISLDSYPDWHNGDNARAAYGTAFWFDMNRTFKNKPFMLMESVPGTVNWRDANKLKRPGMDTLASLQAVAHGSDTVQYFQFRKSRGSFEKFHGAIVDHVGTDETRIFKAVQTTGAMLKKIDEVAGSGVDSRVAIVYDWANRWALDETQGFKKHRGLDDTCIEYYRTLWQRGINVDVTAVDRDWSGYDLVILPMLYMTSDATIERIRSYVEGGGTVYATYTLGMVDDTDLCHLGGFPGGVLKQVFGIWNEEIDSLYDSDSVTVKMGDTVYSGRDFCEVIHSRGAKVLAEYDSQFYKGMPALTVNSYGKGKAYYQAFRDNGEFKDDALAAILDKLGIKGAIPCLPEGVTAHTRQADGVEYLFVENYTDTEATDIALGAVYTDMITGETVDKVDLAGYDIKILKR